MQSYHRLFSNGLGPVWIILFCDSRVLEANGAFTLGRNTCFSATLLPMRETCVVDTMTCSSLVAGFGNCCPTLMPEILVEIVQMRIKMKRDKWDLFMSSSFFGLSSWELQCSETGLYSIRNESRDYMVACLVGPCSDFSYQIVH